MKTRSSFVALASAVLAFAGMGVANIAANTFADPYARRLQHLNDLEKLLNPSPIYRPALLQGKAFRPGLRARLKKARREYFGGLIPLGGTPTTRFDAGSPAIMNRAARRAAARKLRYFPT